VSDLSPAGDAGAGAIPQGADGGVRTQADLLRAAALLDKHAPGLPARDRLNVYVSDLPVERQRELLADLAVAGAAVEPPLKDAGIHIVAAVKVSPRVVVRFYFYRGDVAEKRVQTAVVEREVWALVPPARDGQASAGAASGGGRS
jgi:hypothetical protein